MRRTQNRPLSISRLLKRQLTGWSICTVLPDGWTVLKEKTAGQVRYALASSAGIVSPEREVEQ